MQLTIVSAGSVLTPQGSVDVATRPQLLDAGFEVLRAEGCLTLNLKAVDFMDSIGIGAMVELSKFAASIGARFTIIEPSPAVQRVLSLTGLTGAWAPVQQPSPTEPPGHRSMGGA